MTGEPTGRQGRLPGAVWWFSAGYGWSAVGTGATYPFLTIYLHDGLGLSAPFSALALLVLAAVAIPLSVLAGRWCDARPTRQVALVGLAAQAAGWLLLSIAGSVVGVLAALALVGVGTGIFLPVVVPLLHGLTSSSEQQARAQSVRYLLLNAGLGAGAAVAAVALRHPAIGTYRWLFVADAVSCLLYSMILALRVPNPPPAPAPLVVVAPGQRRVWRNGNIALLLLAQLLLVTFGLSQIELGIPLLLRARLGISPAVIGLLFALGTVVVVAGQLPGSRLVERVHKTRALGGLATLWLLAWLLGAAATTSVGPARVALLIAMILAFTLGECAYSPAFYSLVGQLAPTGALGRSSGATWAVYNLGNMIGPPVAVLVISAGPATLLWLVLAAASVLTGATVLILDHRLHRHRRLFPAAPAPQAA